MRKHHLLSLLLVLTLSIMLSVTHDSYAQGTPVVVRIAPTSAQVGVGQTVDLAIEVVSVQGMYGFDVDLSFNPSAVEVVDADPDLTGVQVSMGTFMDSGFMIINQADNVAGTLRFAMTQLNPSTAKSGTGNLVVMRFRGKQTNPTSEVMLNSVKIAQPDGTKIPTSPISGQIQVVQNVPGPTNTGVPTQGAGTPMPTESTVAPVINTATRRPVVSNPTSQSISTQSGLSVPSSTIVPLLTGTNTAPAATLAGLVNPSATNADLQTGTSIESTQPSAADLTSTSGIESTIESATVTISQFSSTATLRALQSKVTVILLTQNSPTRNAPGSVLVAGSIIGLFILIGLAAILLVFVVVFIVNKRRQSN